MTLDKHEQRAVEIIARFGWMVMQVAPRKGDAGDLRWFAYTVGLPVTHGWPELICFGMSTKILKDLLNNAVNELKRLPAEPVAGLILNEVMQGYPTRLEEFPEKFYPDHLGWAGWYARYRSLDPKSFSCLQLVLPDKDGRFPSDPLCDEQIRKCQAPVITTH